MTDIFEEFNKKYNCYGWIADKTIDEKIIVNCNKLNDINKVDEIISKYYTEEFINIAISRYRIFEKLNLENLPTIGTLFYKYFIDRDHIIQNALKNYLLQDYSSCVLYLLTVIDGITQDIDKQYGFFSNPINDKLELKNDTYLNVDKINKTSLQEVNKLLYLSRNKTNNEPITIPYRNGILHGRDLNYGNKVVASKCWNILFALIYLGKDNNLSAFKKEEEKNTKPLTIEKIKKHMPNDFSSFIELFKNYLIDEKKRYKLIYMDKTPSNIYPENRRIDDMKRYFCNEFETIYINSLEIVNLEHINSNRINCSLEIVFDKDGINYIKNDLINFEYLDLENNIVSLEDNQGYWKTDFAILLGSLVCNAEKKRNSNESFN